MLLVEKGVRGKGRQPLSPPQHEVTRRALARRLWATFLAHGIATHLDTMSVVNQTIEDAVGGGGIADLFVPARHRELGGEDRRAGLVTILADFPEVAALGLAHWSHGPVVDH